MISAAPAGWPGRRQASRDSPRTTPSRRVPGSSIGRQMPRYSASVVRHAGGSAPIPAEAPTMAGKLLCGTGNRRGSCHRRNGSAPHAEARAKAAGNLWRGIAVAVDAADHVTGEPDTRRRWYPRDAHDAWTACGCPARKVPRSAAPVPRQKWTDTTRGRGTAWRPYAVDSSLGRRCHLSRPSKPKSAHRWLLAGGRFPGWSRGR
jgi:hypothetical protein